MTRYDYEYRRKGERNWFLFFEPLASYRHVRVARIRTKRDFAHTMKWLVDERYPQAGRIRVVLDKLNTHTEGALYEKLHAPEAHCIHRKLGFHYTPRHASWLNMAEIELSVLARPCSRQCIGDEDTLVAK